MGHVIKCSVFLLVVLIFASVNTAQVLPLQIGGPGDAEQILIGTTGND